LRVVLGKGIHNILKKRENKGKGRKIFYAPKKKDDG